MIRSNTSNTMPEKFYCFIPTGNTYLERMGLIYLFAKKLAVRHSVIECVIDLHSY